jgi:endonuclease-3
MKTTDPTRRRARRINRLLRAEYPDAHCALQHEGPFQLLIATILSAQCTDVQVNKVTPALFQRFPDPAAFAAAARREVEPVIQSLGFFRSKANNIIRCCQQLVERHAGQVPQSMDELVALAGVGRKTANVVLGNSFGVPGLVVDTHVGRLSRRLGLTTATDPVKVEHDLMALLPRQEWTMFSHRMIFHGRRVCRSLRPRCESCVLARVCPRVGVALPANDEPRSVRRRG